MDQIVRKPVRRLPGTFGDVSELLLQKPPALPVYCHYSHLTRQIAHAFLSGFPGDVLYAVKANPALPLLDTLYEAGICHFDTASAQEIRLVKRRFPNARCYFMAPVRVLGVMDECYKRWGVRDYVLDSDEEFEKILGEIGARDLTLYVRLKTDVGGANLEQSSKFGASQADAVRLLGRIAEAGCRPGLAFHVGSQCLDADAFGRALEICRNILARAEVRVEAIDVGGGFPAPYLGNAAPALSSFFGRIKLAAEALGLEGVRLLCEPGRGLSAHSMSLVAQVIGRRPDRVYLNDGIYGSFAETMIPNSRIIYPFRVLRLEAGRVRPLSGGERAFGVYGPTCDSHDVLPHPLNLPADIRTGDFVEFGLMGAYNQAYRTEFNGFFPDEIIEIGDRRALPPGVAPA